MTKQSFFEKVTPELINYSAKDVFVLEIIQQEQYRQLTNASMLQVAEIEFKLVPLLVDIELTGIKIDTKKWEEIIAEASLNKEKILTEINKIVTVKENNLFSESSININSPKVLKQIFSNFGIEISDTSERTLKAIDHPIAQKLLEYRTYEKQLTSFGKEFLKHINIVTGRIHPAFQQIGADTGRFSCTKPNLQQIPAKFKKYRECFITEQDYSILACDYSQQELRILASLSGDPKFIQFYKDGVDLHAATASLMFDIPIDKVEKDTHRRIAKNINFGLVYGQGAKRLAETIGKTTEEAEALINKYFSQFTYIKEWLSKASQEAIINGYSKTMYGRKRYYNLPTESSPDRNELLSRIGRRGKNTPIQGTASDMMKIALIGIHEYLQSKSLLARIINVVHDEVVLEVKNDIAQTVAEEVKNIMVHAGESLINNVPITAEYGIHEFWQH